MTVHVRMREAWLTHRVGEDLALDGATAKFLQADGKAWITGGDPQEMRTHGIEADAEVGAPILYPSRETFAGEVTRGGQ